MLNTEKPLAVSIKLYTFAVLNLKKYKVMANSKVNMSEWEKSLMAKNDDILNSWKNEYAEVMNLLQSAIDKNTYKAVYGDFYTFCPWSQYIRLDALNKEDWPNGIKNNSIFVSFEIDLANKKVEINSCGNVWISKQDKELYTRDSYLAMHTMTEITKRNGGKVMRKSTYKDAKNLANRIINAFEGIMEQVIDYTSGYPYKEGVKALKTA